MQRTALFLSLVALAASSDVLALGSLADVEVIDRASGESLGVHYFRGEYWVAGRPGAKYAVRVRNHSGGRVLAVMAVDGVNVLSGATAGFDQQGYIFSAGSYAERTGRPANVGVIGVALFRERAPPVPVTVTPPAAVLPAPANSAAE